MLHDHRLGWRKSDPSQQGHGEGFGTVLRRHGLSQRLIPYRRETVLAALSPKPHSYNSNAEAIRGTFEATPTPMHQAARAVSPQASHRSLVTYAIKLL